MIKIESFKNSKEAVSRVIENFIKEKKRKKKKLEPKLKLPFEIKNQTILIQTNVAWVYIFKYFVK